MTPEIMKKIAERARQITLENAAKGIDINSKGFSYPKKPFKKKLL